MVRNPAHHAASLGDPVMLAHPYALTDRDTFWLHEATPAAWGHNRASVGFEGQLLLFSVYLGVLELVGPPQDDLLGLFF